MYNGWFPARAAGLRSAIMLEGISDTIVAVSTPPGPAVRGVVRLSGTSAVEISGRLFQADPSGVPAGVGGRRSRGRVAVTGNAFVLPAEAFWFRAPRSYTREDIVEIHTSGAPVLLGLLVDRAVDAGARRARPGEFTARAFYRGALSLTEVEGIGALIHARSDRQLAAAREWLEGRLAQEVRALRDELIDLVALVEADIDFAEESIEFIAPSSLTGRIDRLLAALGQLLDRSETMIRAGYLPRVLWVGPPNAGKSTLLNRLCGTNRALCSPIPGTTRDLLAAIHELPGGQIEVLDSAGWSPDLPDFQEFCKNFCDREMGHVELVCQVLDLSSPAWDAQTVPSLSTRQGPVFWVANKVDCVSQDVVRAARQWVRQRHDSVLHVVSATGGQGLEHLRAALNEQLFGSEECIVRHGVAIAEDHRAALRGAVAALRQARRHGADHNRVTDRAEWIADDLRAALGALAGMFGEVTVDDLLQRIFARFCIGK